MASNVELDDQPKELQRRLRTLEARTELGPYRVEDLSHHALTPEDLSDFVERNWNQAYPGEERLRFTPALIAWISVIGDDRNSLSRLAIHDDQIVGLVLGVGQALLVDGVELQCAFHTCWTTDQEHASKGLGQLLLVQHLIAAARQGYDVSQRWYDTRHHAPGSALWLAERDKVLVAADLDLFGKTLKRQEPQDQSASIRQYHRSDLPVVKSLATEALKERPMRVIYSDAQWQAQLDFSYGGEQVSITYLFEKQEQTIGYVQGFVNRDPQGNTFFIDQLVFRPGTDQSAMETTIQLTENVLVSEHDCYAAVALPTNTSEGVLPEPTEFDRRIGRLYLAAPGPIRKLIDVLDEKLLGGPGFTPIDYQTLAVRPLRPEEVSVKPTALEGAFLPLR